MIKELVIPHFARPRGPLGWFAGRIMATRESNVERNHWVAEILAPGPEAEILEIGHGPGLAIERLWPRLDQGRIVGVDISPLMSRTAARRNSAGKEAGKVVLQVADSADLPSDTSGFDIIFGVNASMFWDDPPAVVRDLASRLKPGGELVLVFMPPPTSDTTADSVAGKMNQWFRAAGLIDIRSDWMDFAPPAVAVRGRATG